jgi:hypothetical protein
MDTKTRTKRHFVLLVKHPSLWTNCKRTVDICGAFVEFLRHEVSGKPVKWKPRYRRSVKGPLINIQPQPNLHSCITSVEIVGYYVPGKSPQWKLTYRPNFGQPEV